MIYAVSDPISGHDGGGALLAREGIEVQAGVLRDAAERMNEAWLESVRLGRPHVTWIVRVLLDWSPDEVGRIGDLGQQDLNAALRKSDAVVTEVAPGCAQSPPRVALHVPLGDIPPSEILVADETLSWGGAATSGSGREDPPAPSGPAGPPDGSAVLAALYRRGCRAVAIWGSPDLARRWMRGGLLDKVVCYVAPVFPDALSFRVMGALHAGGWRVSEVAAFGTDHRLVFYRSQVSPSGIAVQPAGRRSIR